MLLRKMHKNLKEEEKHSNRQSVAPKGQFGFFSLSFTLLACMRRSAFGEYHQHTAEAVARWERK